MKKWLLYSIVMAGFSCNDIEDCQLDPYVDFVGLKFTLITENADLIIFDSVRLDGLGVFDIGTTSNVFPDTISANLFLPIDVIADQSTYSFFTDSTDYFLTISYEKEAYIFETDCDAGIRYNRLRVVESNLDSISLIFDQLNRSASENIEIFF